MLALIGTFQLNASVLNHEGCSRSHPVDAELHPPPKRRLVESVRWEAATTNQTRHLFFHLLSTSQLPTRGLVGRDYLPIKQVRIS